MKAQLQKQKKDNDQLLRNLPAVIADVLMAQNNFDSTAYTDCFAETAVVFDEGKTHKGKKEIKDWIEAANRKYKTVMKPIEYSVKTQVLKAEIAGNFPGSPLVLNYRFGIKEEKIHLLKII